MSVRLLLYGLLLLGLPAASVIYVPISRGQFIRAVARPTFTREWKYSHVAPARQDYYWDPKLSPEGLLVPCWQNPDPGMVIGVNKPWASYLRKSWFKISDDFIDMQRLKYTGLVVDPDSDAIELSPFHTWTFDDSPQMFLCAAHGYVNRTIRINFFELHFVQLPLDFGNQLSPNGPVTTSIDVSFESYASDPFPPGCSYAFGKDWLLKDCTSELKDVSPMPEFQANSSGIILDAETLIEDTLVGLRRNLLAEADAICAKYECEASLKDRISSRRCILPKSDWTAGRKEDMECDKIIWTSTLANEKESRVTHNVHWIPTLTFTFKAQLVNCDVIKPTFDIMIPREQRPYEYPTHYDWVYDTPFRGIVNQLETVYWRSRALPHQAYYAPTACTEYRGDAKATRAFFKPRNALDVYNGFTIIFYVKSNASLVKPIQILHLKNFTMHLQNSDVHLLKLELQSTKFSYWKLNLTFWIESDLNISRTVSSGILHFPLDQPFSPEDKYRGYGRSEPMLVNSTFVLLVDGPHYEMKSNNPNWEVRRMRLIKDSWVLAESRIFVPNRNYIKTFGRRPQAKGKDTMPFIANSLEVFVSPINKQQQLNMTFKILNWPDYDFLSPVESRNRMAWVLASKGCAETDNQPIFPTPIWRDFLRQPLPTNLDSRYYWASNQKLCNDVCKPTREHRGDKRHFSEDELVCHAPDLLEPCSRDNYFTKKISLYSFVEVRPRKFEDGYTKRRYYEPEYIRYDFATCKYRRYLEARREFCDHNWDWELYRSCKDQNYEFIDFSECNRTHFYDSETGISINCEVSSTILFLSHTCRFNLTHKKAGFSQARIQYRPVVGPCTRTGPFNETVRPNDIQLNATRRASGMKRRCPPGQFIAKMPPIQCEACPPNTFADLNTPDDVCEPCPDMRNTTDGAWESTSLQCSNGILNVYRSLARLANLGYSTSFGPIKRQIIDRTLNKHRDLTADRLSGRQIMTYLEPQRSILTQQIDAETLFQEMTQITFSPGELFSMTMISLGLAVFFAALTFIIAVSSRRGALAAVDKSVIQKGLSRLWRRISIVIRIIFLRLRARWRAYRDRRPSWQRRLSAVAAREPRNIFRMRSIQRQKAEYEHMEEQRLKLINQVIQLSQEANEKADAVRQQELRAWEQLQAEKEARGEPTSRLAEPPESSLFRLGPLEADPIRLPPYRGPKDLKAWLFPPRREIPSFFFFRDAEVKDKLEDKTEG